MINRKKYFSAFAAFLISVFFFSCSKKEYSNPVNGACEDFLAPDAYNNGPIAIGSTLNLTGASDEVDVIYEWTGPENFLSHNQNPVINNIPFNAGGIYYARVSNDQCISNTGSTKVIVNAPCSIAENNGVFGTATWNFYDAIICESNASGHYYIKGSCTDGTLEIKFSNNNVPAVNKIYGIDYTLNPVFDSSFVQLILTNSSGIIYAGQSGNVYVSTYDNISAVFCNVPFKSSATGALLIGAAKLNCQ